MDGRKRGYDRFFTSWQEFVERIIGYVKSKANPLEAWKEQLGLMEFEAPRISKHHMEVVKLSTLSTGCLYLQVMSLLLKYVSRHQDHSAARRIKSKKNPSDPIGNGKHDLQPCSPVPQPAAPPRAPF
jgi:hypothetical protein